MFPQLAVAEENRRQRGTTTMIVAAFIFGFLFGVIAGIELVNIALVWRNRIKEGQW